MKKETKSELMRYFKEICAIPHGSGNTGAIRDYCVHFAQENTLDFHTDNAGNITIYKNASPGYEKAETVILQGHLDMVCAKTDSCKTDMKVEPVQPVTDGDFIFARGTTLGADDAIGLAIILTILSDSTAVHPAIEAVFTADEETGMNGAKGLDFSLLCGKKMINLDSEEEGIITAGCAGGCRTECVLPVKRDSFLGECSEITVSGLLGGHSGSEINKERANAAKLVSRLLYAVSTVCEMRIVSIFSGEKDNAIPRNAIFTIFTEPNVFDKVEKALNNEIERIRLEYNQTDPDITISIKRNVTSNFKPLDKKSTDRTLTALMCCPNGLQNTSPELNNIPQTSLNLGIVSTDNEKITARFCVRSLFVSQKEYLNNQLGLIFASLSGNTSSGFDYPAWQYRNDSVLCKTASELFSEMYNRECKKDVIHGGVECGIFADNIKDLDCISIGPDITGAHTPDEKLSVSSSERTLEFVSRLLERLCKSE